jgi:iron complex outermembrane receptor protein
MRSPDQQERYFALKRMGIDWVGNPGLVPIANTGLEGELEFVRRRLRVAFNVFDWWLDDFIVVRSVTRQSAVPGVINTRARTFANVDARMRGAELSVSVPLARRVFVAGSGSWLRGTERTDGSPDLAEIPPARGTAALSFDDGRFNAAFEIVAAARQDHVDTTLGEQPTPGYTVLNARVGLKRGRLGVTVGLNNLLDRAYFEHLSFQRDPFRNGVRVYEPGLSLFANATFGF